MTSETEVKSPIPDWLNEQFFEDIFVEKHGLERGQFVVKVRAIIPTGGAGENYTSMLYRANVDAECGDGTTKNLAVIIKAMISVPALKEFGVFTKEKFAYDTVLPTMEAEWAKAGTEIQFGPRCWKTIEGEVDIIVLDDLCSSGYQVANRQKGADFKHAHLLLAKLAKYHAATAVDYRKNGPINPLFNNGMVQETARDFFDKFLNAITPVFLDSLSSWEECDKFKPKMTRNMKDTFDKLFEATKKDDSGFVALCHGDVWTNNHMFSYHESGDPKDVLLIDFQGPYYGSPVLELFYYIVSSTTLELKTNHFDELIQYYQNQLADSLRKLDYPERIPTLRDIHIEMLKRAYFGMQCLYGILPVVLANKSENANFAGFVGEEEENVQFRHDVFNNPLYHQHLRPLLKMFDLRGYLDHE
uniref:(northern house mosquito) hypothetical protein n=2 Tax=Culex pipiens TaxID=7175 RepID=A0A8D8IBY7_CULPI